MSVCACNYAVDRVALLVELMTVLNHSMFLLLSAPIMIASVVVQIIRR